RSRRNVPSPKKPGPKRNLRRRVDRPFDPLVNKGVLSMAQYVDGFLLPVPKKNVAAYRRLATKASKIWREHGALEYRECVGDDLNVKGMVSFLRGFKTKPGETVVFAYITYKSREIGIAHV